MQQQAGSQICPLTQSSCWLETTGSHMLLNLILCLCCFNVGYHPAVTYAVKIPIKFKSSMRINRGNFLLVGLPAGGCLLLPAIAECGLTLLTGLNSCDHITSTQWPFHSLPIKWQWINFKLTLLTFKALRETGTVFSVSLNHSFGTSVLWVVF